MSAYGTIGQLIKAAYANLGVVDLGNDLSPEQYEQGLNSLNAMLGSWSRQRITLQGLFDETYTLTGGKAEYSIGTGADFNATRPIDVDNAFIREGGVDYPVRVITANQYDSIPIKTVSLRPSDLVFNPRTSTVTFFPVPESAHELHWTVQKLITSFATTEAAITLPEEYEEAMEYNLSIRLAPKCSVNVTQDVAAIATQSMGSIVMAIEPATFDGAFSAPGRYNVYSDGF